MYRWCSVPCLGCVSMRLRGFRGRYWLNVRCEHASVAQIRRGINAITQPMLRLHQGDLMLSPWCAGPRWLCVASPPPVVPPGLVDLQIDHRHVVREFGSRRVRGQVEFRIRQGVLRHLQGKFAPQDQSRLGRSAGSGETVRMVEDAVPAILQLKFSQESLFPPSV